MREAGSVTLTAANRATSLLELACDAATRLGASGVLLLTEGPMDWEAVRAAAGEKARVLAAVAAPRQAEAARKAGLTVIAVEPSEAAVAERITLALIAAVAD